MKTYLRRDGGRIQLVVHDATKAPKKRDVVAAMSNFASTQCWEVTDIRLRRHRIMSPYSASGSAEDYHSSLKPETAAEAKMLRSYLREYVEDADGTIRWCTFEGIVRGLPEINGYRPVRFANFDQSGYFAFADALRYLEEAKVFWDAYEGDPAAAALHNPHRQVTESALMFEMRVVGLCGSEIDMRIATLPAHEKGSGVQYSFWEAATQAVADCGGDPRAVDWLAVSKAVAHASMVHNGQEQESVRDFLRLHSPGVVTGLQKHVIDEFIENITSGFYLDGEAVLIPDPSQANSPGQ